MKTKRILIPLAALIGVPSLLLGANMLARPNACEATARALREASRHDAHSAFWVAAADCFNDANAHVPSCLQEAGDERDEALDEAEDQFRARMQLCAALGSGAYDPQLNPAEFSSAVTNPYFPLPVGRTLIYEKQTTSGLERVEVASLNQTVTIAGVECRVVHAVESLNGVVAEDTHDWFAQHASGAVWYLGEIALNYEDGFLADIDGSWRAGVDGAKAGILMPAAPAIGDVYRQEFLPNVAEDVGRVVATGVTISVAYGTFHNCVKTMDGSPLEPGNFEYKYYAPGVGLVAEEDPANGEILELVQIL